MNETNKQVALLPEPENLNPTQLLQIALQKGVEVEQLRALMELQRDWKADQARAAFVLAMNAFRAESIEIVKGKHVRFGNTDYWHANLADIVTTVVPALSKHGLSHRWETKQDGDAITVSCIITHQLGHSEETSLTAKPDTSGSKNPIQAIGSAVTYLQRYTFLAITGLAAKDQDTDSLPPAAEVITEQQAADLAALMEEVGVVGERRQRALKAWKVDALEQILAKDYAGVVRSVESKRR